MILNLNNATISIDFTKGAISSLNIRGIERLTAQTPLFHIQLRDTNGVPISLCTYDAKSCQLTEDGAIYSEFDNADISVRVSLRENNSEAEWKISVTPENALYFVEWVDFPTLTLPKVTESNGNKILFPYNEGVLISDSDLRDASWLHHREPEYPSMGCYSIFPNMLCSQMISYIFADAGLYIGAHDKARGVKEIDFVTTDDALTLRMRHFCGTDFGQEFKTDYPVVFSITDNCWESSAERYREWFESCPVANIPKTAENSTLPEWYADSPLVVTYPIRGIHDEDEMTPNKMYPYTNALPTLQRIKDACHSRLLVLLMHWEGTAPWAPPHVWPPFADAENFDIFTKELHKQGDLLGVYCSGFGYTIQSKLVPEYNKEQEYKEKDLWRAMCAAPDGKVYLSKICEGQRSGYDICPSSEVGKALLKEAYSPLFESELDYAQILDQNHGGGQYFCYSKEHGHAPAPGPWMTLNMQEMLSEWKAAAGKMAFGCESAAAEPFISNLQFSDNRYELNFFFGTPVPLYAYIHHEYVRNFMGNQVCCPFSNDQDTLRYRLAYSFSIGDSMTLVINQDGDPVSYWGMRDFSVLPDREKALTLIANLTKFYQEQAKPYLYDGRMIKAPKVECESISFAIQGSDRTVTLPTIISSAWTSQTGENALVLVNSSDSEATCKVNGKEIKIPALDAVLIRI